MDDFLTRLAGRQLHPGTGVRPARPARFEPSGAPTEPWAEDARDLPPLLDARALVGAEAGARPDQPPTPPSEDGAAQRRTPPLTHPVATMSPPTVPSAATPGPVDDEPSRRQPGARTDQHNSAPGAAHQRPRAEAEPSRPVTRPTARGGAEPVASGPASRRPVPDPAERVPAPSPRPAPPADLPPSLVHGWRPEPSRPLTAPAPPEPARTAASPEIPPSPHVTVTIGRLEIRAPAAASAASQPRRERPEPRLTLADYLTERDQGRR